MEHVQWVVAGNMAYQSLMGKRMLCRKILIQINNIWFTIGADNLSLRTILGLKALITLSRHAVL